MWFLVLQILVLLILAALFGALLMYWWMKNQYEDVTESYEDLTRVLDLMKNAPKPVTAEDLDQSRIQLEQVIAKIPQADMSRVETRLAEIVQGLQPLPNIDQGHGALAARLAGVEASLAELAENAPRSLEEKLSHIEANLMQLSGETSSAVQERLSRIEEKVQAIVVPEVDLGPVHSGLAALDLAVSNIDLPVADLNPLRQHLGAMESRLAEFAERLDGQRKADSEALTLRLQTVSSALASLRMPDVEGLRERLSRIENNLVAAMPDATDLTPVLNKLADLEGGTAALHSKLVNLNHRVLEQGDNRIDLVPVQNRLSALEAALGAVRLELQGLPDLGPVERRLSALQETVLANRDTDFTPVLSSVRKMETRLNSVALEDRLASIEYNLAALQHLLRARSLSEQSYQTTIYETRTEVPSWFTDVEPAKPRADRETGEPEAVQVHTVVEIDPSDPLAHARREGDEANLLTKAAFGEGDELERIIGIGPMLGELLNDIGVYYFWQIAEWSPSDIEWVDDKLEHFKGRIERDKWVEQAGRLAKEEGAARRPLAASIT